MFASGMPSRVFFEPRYASFDIPVLADGLLNREVPLLRIARAVVAIHAEDALSQARSSDWAPSPERVGPLDSVKARVHVVLRLLAHRLHERKLRNRERRRDARLLEEDHAVAGAHHPAIADSIGQPDARPEVAAFQFARGVRKIQHLRVQVEDGALIVNSPWTEN